MAAKNVPGEKDPVNTSIQNIVGKKIGLKWRDLARLLGIDNIEIESIYTKFKDSGEKEMCIQALELWQQQKSKAACVGALIGHLQDMERNDIIDDIRQYLKKQNSESDKSSQQEDVSEVTNDAPSTTEATAAASTSKTKREDDIFCYFAIKVLEDSKCHLCCKNPEPLTYDNLMSHLMGEKHSKKVRSNMSNVPDLLQELTEPADSTSSMATSSARQAFQTKKCSICNKTFNKYDQVVAHLNGKDHKRKVK